VNEEPKPQLDWNVRGSVEDSKIDFTSTRHMFSGKPAQKDSAQLKAPVHKSSSVPLQSSDRDGRLSKNNGSSSVKSIEASKAGPEDLVSVSNLVKSYNGSKGKILGKSVSCEPPKSSDREKPFAVPTTMKSGTRDEHSDALLSAATSSAFNETRYRCFGKMKDEKKVNDSKFHSTKPKLACAVPGGVCVFSGKSGSSSFSDWQLEFLEDSRESEVRSIDWQVSHLLEPIILSSRAECHNFRSMVIIWPGGAVMGRSSCGRNMSNTSIRNSTLNL
jgi:hypothetical protein